MIPLWMIYFILSLGVLWFFISYSYKQGSVGNIFLRIKTKSPFWKSPKPSLQDSLGDFYQMVGTVFIVTAMLMAWWNFVAPLFL